jgi:hypothetical protein
VQAVSAATAIAHVHGHCPRPRPRPAHSSTCCSLKSSRGYCYCYCPPQQSSPRPRPPPAQACTLDRQPWASLLALRPPSSNPPLPHPCTPLHPALPLSALRKRPRARPQWGSITLFLHQPYAIRHPRPRSRQALQNRPSKNSHGPWG